MTNGTIADNRLGVSLFLLRLGVAIVMIMHAISTLASFPMYLGFDNMLFFVAWPMLAACIALFLLRDHDRTLSVSLGNPAQRGASA